MRVLIASVMFLYASVGYPCNSDYDCGTNQKCLKDLYSSSGYCANRGGYNYTPPSPNSVGPKMDTDGMCQFTTDCEIGYTCRKNGMYGYCVK